MKDKLFLKIILVVLFNSLSLVKAELPNEEEIVVCQDMAENFGNGSGKDNISQKCLILFKKLSVANNSMKESLPAKMKVYGIRNMIIIEKETEKSILTDIIAGNSTELKSIKSMAIDEKNQELVALEDSGDVLFFSSKITGNVAPFRILKHKELLGASELVIDNNKDQVIINNDKTKKVLFFSRMANVNALSGKQKLNILKSFDTKNMEFKNLSIDQKKSELHGVDISKSQNVVIDLTK